MDISSDFALDIEQDSSLLYSALADACPESGCLRRGIVTIPPSYNKSKSHERFNYNEYTRYVSNLNCVYSRIDRRAEVVSTIRDLGKGHRGHSLSIYIDGVGQTLDLEEQRVIEALAQRCSENNEAWIVMDLTLDVVYMSQVLPKEWIADIAPYIKSKDEYIEDDFLFWRIEPCEILCQPCATAQERAVTDRYLAILDQLLQLYKRGSIVNCTDQFARDWELERDELGIYHPTWWNTILTSGDPTLYLQTRGEKSNYQAASEAAYRRLEAMSDLS